MPQIPKAHAAGQTSECGGDGSGARTRRLHLGYCAQFDFAVIGAGIAGASAAAQLAKRSRVLLLEQEPQPGYHTTGRSAALFSALYGNGPVRALTRASRGFFDAPPVGFAEYPLLSPRGVLFAGTDADQDAVAAICSSPLARSLPPALALEKVPVLRQERLAGSAFEPDACDIDVHALHQGYLRLAKAAGAVMAMRAKVIGLERKGVWQIQTGAGAFHARIVINAAGAWADHIATLAGANALGILPLRRTAVLLDAPQRADSARWPAVIGADESYYFKPDAGLILASPADETPSAPCDAQPEELDVAICLDRIEQATTLDVRRVVRRWAGLRSFAPDRTPVVGYDACMENFFWLAGQGGYGVQTAPAMAELAAALALCDPAPSVLTEEGFEVSSVSPARFDRMLQRSAA